MERFDIEEKLDELTNLFDKWFINIIEPNHHNYESAKKEIISAFKSREWVSVDERTPKDKEVGVFPYGGVLVLKNGKDIMAYTHTYNLGDKKWYGYGQFAPTDNITHWMPLPVVK